MFCGSCGSKIADDDAFCPECGARMQETPPAEKQAEYIPEAPKAFRGVIFEEKEPSYRNANPIPEAREDETVIAQPEEETQISEPEMQQEEQAPVSAPALDFGAVKSPLFREDDGLLAPKPVNNEPEEDATVIAPQEEEPATEFAPASEEATEFSQSEPETVAQIPDADATAMLSEDSYNVYSGAVPGVSSQDFRYPTNDNAYPDLKTEMAPAFETDATQGFDYGAQAYATPVDTNYQPEQVYNNNPYQQQNMSFQPKQPYAPVEPPKKKNTAMWIIIICISVVIVALGASVAVILTQYDSFEDFFASFSDEKKEDKDDKKKDKDKVTEPAETTEPTTVELTTEEPTTAPRAYDGYCGMQLMYDFDESTGRLMIFGTGEMSDYSNITTPWSELNVSAVIIEEGVTSVSAGAFSEISPASISVPSTVASFDVLAVETFGAINVSPSSLYYSSSNGVLFDRSMTQLIAYPNMSVSTSYAVPDSVKWIGEYAFYKATNLNYLILGSNVELISDYAFKDCYNIRNFEIPANVTEIRTGVFSGWVKSQNIRIMNAETQAVSDWDAGCGASVVIG